MVIELRVVQFWSEIILVISNRTRAARSFDFEITRIISDQIVLHSVQLPLLIKRLSQFKTSCFYFALMASYLSCTIDESWILKLIEASMLAIVIAHLNRGLKNFVLFLLALVFSGL